jgi:hypothetical protein
VNLALTLLADVRWRGRPVAQRGQALHLLVGHVRAIEDDGNWVAEKGRRREHVDLHKRT